MDFPTICHDGFFKDPDKIREWALTLDYDHPEGNYPGVRSKQIKTLSKNFYEATVSKLLSLWGNYTRKDWGCQLQFQKISRYSADSEINRGWIHQDGDAFCAAVIYLDPNANLDHGTSIYRMKDGVYDTALDWQKKDCDPKLMQFHSDVLGPEQKRDEKSLEIFRKNMKINNNMFDRTLEVKNVYNRVIGYDATQWHCQSNFHMDNDDDFRLTIVAFVTSISEPATKRFASKSHYI